MKLTEAAGKIAEQAYKEEAAKQQGAETSTEDTKTKPNDNVVDADFTEVKEESEDSKAENK